MSATQEKLLADQFGQVVVTLDGDEAGRAATEEIGDHLQRRIFRVKTVEVDEGMPPDQLTTDQMRTELDPLGVIRKRGRGERSNEGLMIGA